MVGGSLEKFAASLPKPRGKAREAGFRAAYQTIDESFLGQLDEYRKRLASAFKTRNHELDSETLTEITQHTLDRLVFMRFLEDKLIEPQHFVSRFGEARSPWLDFVAASRRLDSIYNGIIFKRHGVIDELRFGLDNQHFLSICRELSHLNSPFDFNAIPIHILGSIYERFLGSVIVATDGQVRLVEKPEVRKAGAFTIPPITSCAT